MDERTLARFLSKVDKNGPLPPKHPELGLCWLWKPAPGAGGYCYFSMNGKPRLAHRVSCEHFNGEIPPGYDVDHLCEVRNCVRPSHLKARTHGDNARRARSWEGGASFQRNKTHCPYGHPYSGDNLRIDPTGKRVCRECARRWAREADERKRAANPPQPRPERTHCKRGHLLAEHGRRDADGRMVCRECARQNLRESRERAKALRGPKPERATCKQGHPWTEANLYTDPHGRKHCKTCHNERTLARYHATKTERSASPRRETCANGHPWAGENLYVTPDGLEKCRECARDRNRRHAAKLKAARPAEPPKPPRTHCKHGHELAGDNLYVDPNGRKFCRACTAMYQQRRRDGIATPSPAKSKPRTHCKQGHEMTPENTYTSPGGARKCRECLNRRTREFMRKKRAEGKPESEPGDGETLF